jgi:F420-dependent oxidoreductase-like protein
VNQIKFGIFLPFYAFKGREQFDRVRDAVLECEQLGYDSVWLDDHLMFKKQPILESWTTLSALSTVTSKIRLGTMVLCNGFRNPAVLAKMAATLDVISNGRLEFGIGAGVQEDEHEAYGVPFHKPHNRISRLNESVEIMKKLWTQEKTSYTGKYYTTNGAVCEPKPVQKPHPPITIGGSGETLTLKVTAQHANRYDWGHVPSMDMYKHKLEVLENRCKAVGRDFKEIEKSCWLGGQIFIVSDQKELDKKVAQLKPENVSLEDFKKFNFVATPDDCLREIRRYTSLGVTYFMLFFGDLPSTGSLRLFAEKVAENMKIAD